MGGIRTGTVRSAGIRSPRGHRVDLLAARPEVQGFSGTWVASTVRPSEERPVEGVRIRVADPPHLLANKIEAILDRGRRDPLTIQDFEDIVALLHGCAELLSSLASADLKLRSFVADWARETLATPDLVAIAEAQLPRGGDDVGRRIRLSETLTALTALGRS